MEKIRIGILGKKSEIENWHLSNEVLGEFFARHRANVDFVPINTLREISTVNQEICGCDCLITRPNWGGEIARLNIALDGSKVKVMATLSAGRSHPPAYDKEKVKVYESHANAKATAEFTIWTAITRRRHLHHKLLEMALGLSKYKRYGNLGSLAASEGWVIAGTGHVAAEVLDRVLAMGVSKIYVWTREKSDLNKKFERDILGKASIKLKKFDGEIADDSWLAELHRRGLVYSRSEVGQGAAQAIVIITNNLVEACRRSDICSVHVSVQTDEPDDCIEGNVGGTTGIISRKRMPLKPGGTIINMGRGELASEEFDSISLTTPGLNQLNETVNEYAGYGSDLLKKEVENEHFLLNPNVTANVASTLWAYYSLATLDLLRKIFGEIKASIDSALTEAIVNRSLSDIPRIRSLLDGLQFSELGMKKNIDAYCRYYEVEALPKPMNSNLLVTQHVAGETPDAMNGAAKEVVRQIEDWLISQTARREAKHEND